MELLYSERARWLRKMRRRHFSEDCDSEKWDGKNLFEKKIEKINWSEPP